MDKTAMKAFVDRWKASGGKERANYQLFLTDLSHFLGIDSPSPSTTDESENAYVFERSVQFNNGDGTHNTGFIDLYKRDCFVLEAKQGSDQVKLAEKPLSKKQQQQLAKLKVGTAKRGSASWDRAMIAAKGQAEQYARALPASEGRPPFLLIVDVGHSIELYSEFSRTGGNYVPFPDALRHRLYMDDLLDPDVQELLRQVWTDPMSLDPARRSAKVTREIADRLAQLAKRLEGVGHTPEDVATFLMRCLFTMFAEDVGLLPKQSFTDLLVSLRATPESVEPMLTNLWGTMKTGGFSPILRQHVIRFNGGLFAEATALPLDLDQLELLIEAGKAQWNDVEPAIFGTLLERALNPQERHKLGAHYTPRAYVERLVLPTVIEPLRDAWQAVQATAMTYADRGDVDEAVDAARTFHRQLCEIRILDPACGTGNFLYVTLEHLKRLEGEVLDLLDMLGEKEVAFDLQGFTVDPHQFLGLEVNPRAAAIADLVLWIGHLQWHFRTFGKDVAPPEPVIRDFHNIVCRDAVLDWDERAPMLDADGQPVTVWDGRTTKPHPVTGLEVPDETARIPVFRYTRPRAAEWPAADFVIGNPPFIGTARMRDALGDGYTEAIRAAYKALPESCDFVMYWWHKAAEATRAGTLRGFGFITTNSIRQVFNRRVIEPHLGGKPPISLAFAIPDHPWVDSVDGAAVRIAMTVGVPGESQGIRYQVVQEDPTNGEGRDVVLFGKYGKVQADLSIGANVAGAGPLLANSEISSRGVQLFGSGFIVTREQAVALGLGTIPGLEQHIREYRNGRDLTARPRDVLVIDLFGLTADAVRQRFPAVYQWVHERVKPERDTNNRDSRRLNWWLFGETNPRLRRQLRGLTRYISTVETSKHRFFVWLDASVLPDNMLVVVSSDNLALFGVLNSRVHVVWALAAGGRLGVGNDPRYNKSRCFDTFPFPVPTADQAKRIGDLAEELDAHRKARLAAHPKLTMTHMYNVLAQLRTGEPLDAKAQAIHDDGLVAVLREIHDQLDAAVAAAYGWPVDLEDADILERLVALNAERAAEESKGLVRWLRPDFQAPDQVGTQDDMGLDDDTAAPVVTVAAGKLLWPKTMPEQFIAVRSVLAELGTPATPDAIAQRFKSARRATVATLLDTLCAMGICRKLADTYAA